MRKVITGMSQNTVTQQVAKTAIATAPSEFASDYEKRLTTAAEAMSVVPNHSALALGLSPCQPPALLKALAARAKAKGIDGVRVYYSVSGRHMRNTGKDFSRTACGQV